MADEHWGNGIPAPNNQKDEDWVSDPNNHNILKVNDVNDDNDAKIAAHFINTSNHADARALKAVGKTELDGDVAISNNLTVEGETTFNDDTLINGDLTVNGQRIFINTGNIDGGNGDGNFTLTMGGLTAEKIVIGRNNADNGTTIPHWLRVGKDEEGVSPGLIDANAGGEEPTQNLNLGTGATTEDVVVGKNGNDVVIKGNLLVDGNGAELPAVIDALIDDADPRPLNIGTNGASSADTTIGNGTHTVKIPTSLQVGPTDNVGRIDSGGTGLLPKNLCVGGGTGTDEVLLGNAVNKVRSQSHFLVGTGATAGKIDAADDGVDLQLGTDSDKTKDTVIGQEDRNIKTPGHLLVGTSNNPGRIDAQGTNLTIGGDNTTENVALSRDGKMIETYGVLSAEKVIKLNFNDLILNSSDTANTGSGFHLDTVNNRLEVWVNGNMAGYFDSAGWH